MKIKFIIGHLALGNVHSQNFSITLINVYWSLLYQSSGSEATMLTMPKYLECLFDLNMALYRTILLSALRTTFLHQVGLGRSTSKFVLSTKILMA